MYVQYGITIYFILSTLLPPPCSLCSCARTLRMQSMRGLSISWRVHRVSHTSCMYMYRSLSNKRPLRVSAHPSLLIIHTFHANCRFAHDIILPSKRPPPIFDDPIFTCIYCTAVSLSKPNWIKAQAHCQAPCYCRSHLHDMGYSWTSIVRLWCPICSSEKAIRQCTCLFNHVQTVKSPFTGSVGSA